MNSNLQVPNILEEQDIGLYYHSRRSSLTISDTDSSSPMSRPASQPQLDVPGQAFAPHGSLKSSSLSHVNDVQKDRGLGLTAPILRSKTVTHLPSNVTGYADSVDGSPSFVFAAEKVQRMREWALAFVVGKLHVARQSRSHFLQPVQFDLDLGPVVRAVHPPMYLSPSERENMFVFY